MIRITTRWLRAKGACENQFADFEKRWPEGAEARKKTLKEARELGFDLDWFAEKALSRESQEAHNRACVSAWEAHNRACVLAWEACRKAHASAREAYDKAHDSEAYNKARASAQEAYDKACAPVWEACDSALWDALKEDRKHRRGLFAAE